MKCCNHNVRKCKKCGRSYCKHFTTVHSFKMCYECVSKIIKKFETDNGY